MWMSKKKTVISRNFSLKERVELLINDDHEKPQKISVYIDNEEILQISNGNIPYLNWDQIEFLLVRFLFILQNSENKYVEMTMPHLVYSKRNLKILRNAFNKLVENLYYESVNDAFYWFGCQLSVYKENFNTIAEEYKERFPDSKKLDFVEFEIENYDETYYYSDVCDTYCVGFDEECFSDLRQAIRQSHDEIKDFLRSQKEELLFQKYNTIKNTHPEIFKNNGYLVFEQFIKYANKDAWLRECSFIYRIMHEMEEPPLIHSHIKPGMFKIWINETYLDEEPLTEIKTYDVAHSKEREMRYNLAKNILFQPKK